MNNFDAPNREQFCSVRSRSNTPLQALQLMNDMQYLEAARVMAEEIVAAEGDSATEKVDAEKVDAEKINTVFQRTLSRNAAERELGLLTTAATHFQTRLENAPEDAAKIASWGEKPKRITGKDQEIASLALLINLVFNLDEFVNRN